MFQLLGYIMETVIGDLSELDTPTPKCHGIRSLFVVLFLLKLRVVPHGTKGTGPKFVTRPVCTRS